MRFSKYHALGNDYLVIDPRDWPEHSRRRKLCASVTATMALAPTASCGARCRPGMGRRLRCESSTRMAARRKEWQWLRIFCRYLFDRGLVKREPFQVHTPGGIVEQLFAIKAAA